MKLSSSLFAAVVGLGSLLPMGASADNFADSVVGTTTITSGALYNGSAAALGQPTTLDDDTFGDLYHASMVQPAYGVDQTTKANLLVAFGSPADQLTVQMSAPITHTGTTWYDQDFIVFSNQGFTGKSGFASEGTDMSAYQIGSGATFGTLPQVSVSADNITFYPVTPSSSVAFPENPYHWDGLAADPTTAGWGALNDFSKPVDPKLTAADFANQTVAYSDNTLYDGSAGGTSYDFAGQTPLTTIDYIRFSANTSAPFGVVDGIAAVGSVPVPEASTGWAFLIGLTGLACYTFRRRKTAQATGGLSE